MSKAFFIGLTWIAMLIIGFFVNGFFLMLLAGVLHSWDKAIPTAGWFKADLIALLIRLFAAPIELKFSK